MSDTTPAAPATPPGWYPDPEHAGHQRYWDGAAWTEHRSTVQTVAARQGAGNGAAMAALVLGIIGFVLTPIPFLIGLFVGGLPDVLAIVFGIVGLVRAPQLPNRAGFTPALVGLILGGLGFLGIFVGSGTIW